MRTIRPVREGDVAAICTFTQDAAELYDSFPRARYPLTPEQLSAAIAARSDSTVVEEQGRAVGFANFYHWGVESRCAIGNVMVAPVARGRGVARALIEHMVALAQEKYRASEVTVSCFNHNTAALLLYTRLGFTPEQIEERVGPDGRRVALIHLRHAVR